MDSRRARDENGWLDAAFNRGSDACQDVEHNQRIQKRVGGVVDTTWRI